MADPGNTKLGVALSVKPSAQKAPISIGSTYEQCRGALIAHVAADEAA